MPKTILKFKSFLIVLFLMMFCLTTGSFFLDYHFSKSKSLEADLFTRSLEITNRLEEFKLIIRSYLNTLIDLEPTSTQFVEARQETLKG